MLFKKTQDKTNFFHTSNCWDLLQFTLETGWSWQLAWWTRFIKAPTARGVSKSSASASTTLDLVSANLKQQKNNIKNIKSLG